MHAEMLIERIKQLPPDKFLEVSDFVEFLWLRSVKSNITFSVSDRAEELRKIAQSMKSNIFTGNPPKFSGENLQERL